MMVWQFQIKKGERTKYFHHSLVVIPGENYEIKSATAKIVNRYLNQMDCI